MPEISMIEEEKKYMWNGEEYPDRAAAAKRADEYLKAGFEIKLADEKGKFFIYTRRVAENQRPAV